jgi:hypothetical protein
MERFQQVDRPPVPPGQGLAQFMVFKKDQVHGESIAQPRALRRRITVKHRRGKEAVAAGFAVQPPLHSLASCPKLALQILFDSPV